MSKPKPRPRGLRAIAKAITGVHPSSYQVEALEKRVLLSSYGALATLASFNGTNGAWPNAGVAVDSSGNIFGTTQKGGASSDGTVFEIAHGSGAITALASFNGTNGLDAWGLALDSSDNVFGVAAGGGAGHFGTVFEIAHGSNVITVLASFNGANGAAPDSAVLDSSGNIFGTTGQGGNLALNGGLGDGTVFKIAHGSATITTLASFGGSNGLNPGGVALNSSDDLFSVASSGGAKGDGNVFEVAHGTGVITVLASFNLANGALPSGVVLDSSGNLFGTGVFGGNETLNNGMGLGAVFEVAQGSGAITALACFNGGDGQAPWNTPVLDSSGDIFGTSDGGASGDGTVFEVAQGSGVITTLGTLNGANGQGAAGATLDSSGDLFGVANEGGANGDGTVFELEKLTNTSVSVTSSNASSSYGLPVTFTATVTPASGTGETGTVQFQIDGSNVGNALTLTSNIATYTTSTLDAGSHSVVAVYSGDASFAGSISPTWTQSVATISPRAPMTLVSFNGSDGYAPEGSGVIFDSAGNMYGTTLQGGSSGDGTVFEVASGTQAVTTLASFNATNGEDPEAGVIFDSAGNLYGTTYGGGSNGDGTVFEVASGTQAVTTLASFNATNGLHPFAGVVFDSAGNLYGTTYGGGSNGYGTVFEVASGTQAVTTLVYFNGNNGDQPFAGLVFDSAGNLYGTACGNGSVGSRYGTVFEVASGTRTPTTLVSFNVTNGDQPKSHLIFDSAGNMYGTTAYGGSSGDGTVFEVASGTHALTTLASFNGANGEWPVAGVIFDSAGNLYGATNSGGASNDGTVFEVASGTHAVTTLVSFNVTNGKYPMAGLIFDGAGNLYGTTNVGGSSGDGTVFELVAAGTTVTSSNIAPAYGQPVTFTATVTPNIGVGPTGTVQFQIDGNNVGSPVALSGSAASYTTSTLDAGSHSVVAVYSGDGNFVGMTSSALTQNVGVTALTLSAGATYVALAPDGQHLDVWNNATAAGSPNQCVPCCDICGVTYTGPAGGDAFVLDYSNGDPVPAGGISLTGGAGQNTLEIVGSSLGNSDMVAINGGSFTIPAGTPGAGTANYTLGTVSIAAGASLALGQSDSQADQTVLAVNNLSVAGTLDISNNTLLANETSLPISQLTTLVQNAGVGASIFSSLVTGPDSQASRAVGYGDWNEDPLSVPAGDVEVKYVPFGDTNLDGTVDITDLTRAINNLGLSPGYYGGDVLDLGIVNITDVTAIINNLGATLNASGDGAAVAGEASGAMIPVTPAGAAVPISASGRRPAHAAVNVPPAGTSIPSLFSDSRIQGDWVESNIPILDD